MRMVGPAYWLDCEFERSCRGLRTGETVLEEGGENLGARASGDETGESEAEERRRAEADMLQRAVVVWAEESQYGTARRGAGLRCRRETSH